MLSSKVSTEVSISQILQCLPQCRDQRDSETHPVDAQGIGSVHHAPGEGDAALCPEAAVAIVWEPTTVWHHFGEQSVHPAGHIGVHGPLPAAGEDGADSADLGAATEALR